MKFDKNRYQSILILVLVGVFFYWFLNNLTHFTGFLKASIDLLFPFIIGASIAFVLDVPTRKLEAYFKTIAWLPKKHLRPIALVTTIVILLAVFYLVFSVIIPELVNSIMNVMTMIPRAISEVQSFADDLLVRYPNYEEILKNMQIDLNQLTNTIVTALQNFAAALLSSSLNVISSIINGLIVFVIGFTFAIYALLQKETLLTQAKKILYGTLPENWADRLVYIGNLSSSVFSNFLTGQCLEALILGSIFFVSMLVFRMPYALLISIIITITALIPIFGAIFGSLVGFLLILLINPVQAIWFYVMFQIIQQLENNLIYPHVVGNSVGLPSIWVLFSITVGGNLLGITGMLISIPVFSILYILIREAIHHELARRKIPESKYTIKEGTDKKSIAK